MTDLCLLDSNKGSFNFHVILQTILFNPEKPTHGPDYGLSKRTGKIPGKILEPSHLDCGGVGRILSIKQSGIFKELRAVSNR